MNFSRMFTKVVATITATACILVATAVPTFAASKHTVTFIYGTKVVKQVVDDGCSVLPPTDTYVPGYIFAGWTGNSTNVKSDVTILGAYLPVVQQPAPTPSQAPAQNNNCTYTIRFVDGLTGAEFYSQQVSYGASANVPEPPHHPGYHFDHYDGSFTNVDSSGTVTAVYDADYYDYDYYEDYQDVQELMAIVLLSELLEGGNLGE